MTRTLLLLLLASSPLVAQEPSSSTSWDDPRALELVRTAQARRTATFADSALVDYSADARGYVYFYLDRPAAGERTLVKTDQVALEVFWKAPARSKQRIVGMRDEKKLPARIHYHIDHLSVVQDNFGDLIRLGDGDEVRDVLHPAAPAAERTYQYRIADSLSIRLPGVATPVRVYEVEVRPRRMDQPAFLGSVFIERGRGDLVRMDFTFTPASYIDRYLDYINVSLDNGLWKERFWLPNQQRIEIRRELPELDFPAGGVIRGTMRVSNYRFNQGLPDALFTGPPVVALPRSARESFPFEQGLYDEVREEGLEPDVDLAAVRRQAREIARTRLLSGLPELRLEASTASRVFRYNRAEGAALGAGLVLRPAEALELRLRGGFALGSGHPTAAAELMRRAGQAELRLTGFANQPGDVGWVPGASGAINTLSALIAGRDYSDPYYASGGAVRLGGLPAGAWSLTAGARAESHRSARLESEFSFFGARALRPVREIDDGRMLGGELRLRRVGSPGAARVGSVDLALTGGRLSPRDAGAAAESNLDWALLGAGAEWSRGWIPADARLELRGAGALAVGTIPRQELLLFGGRGTLPGYPYRSFGGDRLALLSATASADLARPWIRGRLIAAVAGSATEGPARRALELWGAEATGGARASLGVGAGLFYDIVRLDLARGLGRGGGWEVIVETRPSFWDFL